MKRAPRSRQRHDLYAKYHDYDSEISDLLGECGFKLVNDGELPHEFVLGTAEEIEQHAEMMRAMPDMKHEDPNAARLQPRAVADMVWRFTSVGAFEFACLIPGHREAGMVGRVVVK